MNKFIILTVVITIIVILFLIRPNDDYKRKQASKLLAESNGEFDDKAQKALKYMEKISTPEPIDDYVVGSIIADNILGGNINPKSPATKLATKKYVNVLRHINDLPARRQQQERPNNNNLPTPNLTDHIPALTQFETDLDAIFMVDRIANFGARVGNQVMLETATTIGANLNQQAIDQRLATVKVLPITIEKRAETFLQSGVHYTNDRQNVHDSSVSNDLRDTYNWLKAAAQNMTNKPTNEQTISEIQQYSANLLKNKEISQQKFDNINKILARAASNEYISTFDAREADILSSVWSRTKNQEKEEDNSTIKNAIIDSIADAVENDMPVCINGRCGRYLTSLATIDSNPELGIVKTKEAYHHEILNNANTILKERIDQALNSEDPSLSAVGKSYKNGTDGSELPEADIQNFVNSVKHDYNSMVSEYLTAGKISQSDADNYTKEIHAAVEI